MTDDIGWPSIESVELVQLPPEAGDFGFCPGNSFLK